MENLQIVPVKDIPSEIIDCPTDSLLNLYKVCLKLSQLCVSHNGIGLSAVQAGIPWRLFVIRYQIDDYTLARSHSFRQRDKFRFFLNSSYTPVNEEKVQSVEGCLSIKNDKGDLRYFQVDRYKNIKVEGVELCVALALTLDKVSFEPEDYYNFVFQHEIDHYCRPETGKPTLISEIGVEYEVWQV